MGEETKLTVVRKYLKNFFKKGKQKSRNNFIDILQKKLLTVRHKKPWKIPRDIGFLSLLKQFKYYTERNKQLLE